MSESHTAETIMRSVRGFMASRILLTGAELDLFTLLASKFMTAEEIAAAKMIDLRGATTLLDALTSLGFLIKEKSRYRTEPGLGPILSSDTSDSILPMILHSATLWKTWSQLTEIVCGKVKPGLEETGALGEGHYSAFIGAMHIIGSRFASEVVAAIDPKSTQLLLDVGGGSGAYTLAFLEAYPEMKATLFDLPRVIGIARAHAQSADMIDRITFVSGNFYEDELPTGHDIALLSAIIHQNSPDQNQTLYQNVYHSLKPGGRIIVRDHVMSEDRTHPPEGAVFAVNMLVGTSGGRTYTFNEINTGLSRAGFERVNLIQTKGMFSLVEGYRPS